MGISLNNIAENYNLFVLSDSTPFTSTASCMNSHEHVADFDRDLNVVIMDYLINEGYPNAAEKFAKEANIYPAINLAAIQDRVDIRNAIHAGDIQSAIEKINELNPQVCYSFSTFFPSPPLR